MENVYHVSDLVELFGITHYKNDVVIRNRLNKFLRNKVDRGEIKTDKDLKMIIDQSAMSQISAFIRKGGEM